MMSAYVLKLFAVLSMVIDHAALAWMYILAKSASGRRLFYVLQGIGRLAFPLFCFLLVEGFHHTRDRWKYLRNLVVLALLSELPSDLFFRTWDARGDGMSIFATLALGILCLILITLCDARYRAGRLSPALAVSGEAALAAAALLLGGLLCVEYGAAGVALIVLLYYVERLATVFWADAGQRSRNAMAAVALVVWLGAYDLLIARRIDELYGIVVVIPILLYSGERGSYRIPKWFFYLFYPAHLVLLILIRGTISY